MHAVVGVLALVSRGGESEVDHHDGVLLHNPDQQNEPIIGIMLRSV